MALVFSILFFKWLFVPIILRLLEAQLRYMSVQGRCYSFWEQLIVSGPCIAFRGVGVVGPLSRDRIRASPLLYPRWALDVILILSNNKELEHDKLVITVSEMGSRKFPIAREVHRIALNIWSNLKQY